MLCAVPSRLPKMRGDINVKDAGREASCSSYTSPRRAGDRSAVCLVSPACVCSRGPPERFRRYARVGTGVEARLETLLQANGSIEMGLVSYWR